MPKDWPDQERAAYVVDRILDRAAKDGVPRDRIVTSNHGIDCLIVYAVAAKRGEQAIMSAAKSVTEDYERIVAENAALKARVAQFEAGVTDSLKGPGES